jgi:hypothetical protein
MLILYFVLELIESINISHGTYVHVLILEVFKLFYKLSMNENLHFHLLIPTQA